MQTFNILKNKSIKIKYKKNYFIAACIQIGKALGNEKTNPIWSMEQDTKFSVIPCALCHIYFIIKFVCSQQDKKVGSFLFYGDFLPVAYRNSHRKNRLIVSYMFNKFRHI